MFVAVRVMEDCASSNQQQCWQEKVDQNYPNVVEKRIGKKKPVLM